MNLITYKQKEGLIIRFVTLILCSLMVLFGCIALYYFIPSEDFTKAYTPSTFWGKLLYTVPFFEIPITIGTIISTVLFFLIVILVNRFMINASKSADFLIDTEFELRKVSWPPKNEYWGSSMAVIISVIIIGAFIFIIDIILRQIMIFVY